MELIPIVKNVRVNIIKIINTELLIEPPYIIKRTNPTLLK